MKDKAIEVQVLKNRSHCKERDCLQALGLYLGLNGLNQDDSDF